MSGTRPRAKTARRSPTSSAYLDGLKMLARRELSETQVRERLARQGHAEPDVNAAVSRLTDEHAIDDARLAEAIARREMERKRRGRRRVIQQIESAGIAGSIARQAAADLFSTVDQDALIEAALTRRLRPGRAIAGEAELRRLYRFLVAQGFELDAVQRVLKSRSVK